jgi:drug/metabolite transporter (DMT)-like permease
MIEKIKTLKWYQWLSIVMALYGILSILWGGIKNGRLDSWIVGGVLIILSTFIFKLSNKKKGDNSKD